MPNKLLNALLVTMVLGLLQGQAIAQLFRPPGLQEGDEYRLAFVTSTGHDALAHDINEYNSFVQAAADSSPLGQHDLTWRALASTANTHAWDNTLTNPNLLGNGVPIYRTDGFRIADGNQGLWDTNGQSAPRLIEALANDENGEPYNGMVYTGIFDGASPHEPLGGPNPMVGHTTRNLWAADAPADVLGVSPSDELPLYAVSNVITADAPRFATYRAPYDEHGSSIEKNAFLTLEWLDDTHAAVAGLSFPQGVGSLLGDYPGTFDVDPRGLRFNRTSGPILNLVQRPDGTLVSADGGLQIVSDIDPPSIALGAFELGLCAQFSPNRALDITFSRASNGIGSFCAADMYTEGGLPFLDWQLVPEPTSGLLMMLGVGLLAARRGKKELPYGKRLN